MSTQFSVYRGTSAKHSSYASGGKMYFATDTREMWVDSSRYGDKVQYTKTTSGTFPLLFGTAATPTDKSTYDVGYNTITVNAATKYIDASVAKASSASSVAWSNVSGRPTDLGDFSNNAGYVQSSGVTEIDNGTGIAFVVDSDDTVESITGTGTIKISDTYQTYITHGNTAYGWGNNYISGISGNNTSTLTFTAAGSAASGSFCINNVAYASSAGGVAWSNVSGKPSSYTPSSHTHTKSQITDFPSSLPASDVYSWAKASSKPSYAWSEITSKPGILTGITDASITKWSTDNNTNYYVSNVTYDATSSDSNHDPSCMIKFESVGSAYSGTVIVDKVDYSYHSGLATKIHNDNYDYNADALATIDNYATTAYGWGNHASAGYQKASTAITTSNIGSQSVNYAASAGAVTWSNVSSKPAILTGITDASITKWSATPTPSYTGDSYEFKNIDGESLVTISNGNTVSQAIAGICQALAYIWDYESI